MTVKPIETPEIQKQNWLRRIISVCFSAFFQNCEAEHTSEILWMFAYFDVAIFS